MLVKGLLFISCPCLCKVKPTADRARSCQKFITVYEGPGRGKDLVKEEESFLNALRNLNKFAKNIEDKFTLNLNQ